MITFGESMMIVDVTGTPFSGALINNYLAHRGEMLNNEAMLSALYLDPRYNYTLTPYEKEKAITAITCTYKRLCALTSEL